MNTDADGPGVLWMIWLGVGVTGLVLWLGVATPLEHPVRDRVDNALLFLGTLGVLNALMLRRARLVSERAGTRAALGCYALTSGGAVALTDWGDLIGVGWTVKAVTLAVLLFTLRDLSKSGV